jgi:hypothetical protein
LTAYEDQWSDLTRRLYMDVYQSGGLSVSTETDLADYTGIHACRKYNHTHKKKKKLFTFTWLVSSFRYSTKANWWQNPSPSDQNSWLRTCQPTDRNYTIWCRPHGVTIQTANAVNPQYHDESDPKTHLAHATNVKNAKSRFALQFKFSCLSFSCFILIQNGRFQWTNNETLHLPCLGCFSSWKYSASVPILVRTVMKTLYTAKSTTRRMDGGDSRLNEK